MNLKQSCAEIRASDLFFFRDKADMIGKDTETEKKIK